MKNWRKLPTNGPRSIAWSRPMRRSPKRMIWTLNKAKLYRYVPAVAEEKRHKIPLILVFAIMNRPHVLDLRPGHSFVEYMPRAIRKLKSVSGSDRFNMLGWCLGALISTLYASLRADDGLQSLVLLT